MCIHVCVLVTVYIKGKQFVVKHAIKSKYFIIIRVCYNIDK